jgi:CDP-diacylglycerol--serine O-phosphatidyltransferase
MNIKKHIPNFLTSCNLLCGCIGIIEIFNWGTHYASYLIFLACVFDFLDGFAARALKVSSPIGKELDSLADMVTFGVLPALIMFKEINFVFHLIRQERAMSEISNIADLVNAPAVSFWSFFALLIAVFSAIRLANFNVDTRQSDRFIGVPTPANALFISAVPFIVPYVIMHTQYQQAFYITLIILCFILSYLLVAELPLIALKFKNYGWPDNKMRYTLIISALVLLAILNIPAIPIIIILYIILSLIDNRLLRTKD